MKRLVLILLFATAVWTAGVLGYVTGADSPLLLEQARVWLTAVTTWFPMGDSASLTLASSSVSEDYEFQLLTRELKQGEGAVVTVRLVHKPSGSPVSDAVVFASRMDMAPEGMPTMTAPLEPIPGGEPGNYAFRTDLTMEGGWQLSLAAKVQGEVSTVQTQLLLTALP